MTRQEQQIIWATHIANFKVSGQSVATWCRDNKIKPYRLSYRLQKENATTTATNARWLSLNLDEPEIASITVKIGQALIEINHGFDPELLLVVVRTLKSI